MTLIRSVLVVLSLVLFQTSCRSLHRRGSGYGGGSGGGCRSGNCMTPFGTQGSGGRTHGACPTGSCASPRTRQEAPPAPVPLPSPSRSTFVPERRAPHASADVVISYCKECYGDERARAIQAKLVNEGYSVTLDDKASTGVFRVKARGQQVYDGQTGDPTKSASDIARLATSQLKR